jgi:cytidylate kinase
MNDTADTADSTRPVVTLWEEYGAGAEEIGPRVAEILGVPFITQQYSSAQLEELEKDADEQPFENLLDLYALVGDNPLAPVAGDTVLDERYDNIADLLRRITNGGVVLGRNATVILADRPNTVRVKLTGPVEQRVERAAASDGISLTRARHRQKREDRVRADIALRTHSWDPHRYQGYDLVLDTGEHTLDECVQEIAAASRAHASLARDLDKG